MIRAMGTGQVAWVNPFAGQMTAKPLMNESLKPLMMPGQQGLEVGLEQALNKTPMRAVEPEELQMLATKPQQIAAMMALVTGKALKQAEALLQ